LKPPFELVGFDVDARVDLVDRAAHQSPRFEHGLRRQPGDMLRGLHCFGFDCVGRGDGVDDAGGFRLVGV